MASPSRSLSLVVRLSLRSVISVPGVIVSKASTTLSATTGVLSLMLVTLNKLQFELKVLILRFAEYQMMVLLFLFLF